MISTVIIHRWINLILLFLVPVSPAFGFTVISIGDGDTLRVSSGDRLATVRLACIDAPEMTQRPYGVESRQLLRQLLPIGSEVSLKQQTTDRYGRTVAEVFIGQNNINQYLISRGQSFVYRRYLSQCDASKYLLLERQAQKIGVGVWSVGAAGIQRPWDFRKQRSASSGTKRKYRCKEIASWEEAQQLLRRGHSYLDRDRDGEACESLR